MYREINPLIENTRCEERIDDKTGALISYRIYPLDGYKLHENSLDEQILDENTMEETGEVRLGYTKSFVTAGRKYDFKKNLRKIYAVKDETEVQ